MSGTTAGAAKPERVALDDASWLQMDSRTNPMVVNVLLELDGRLDAGRVAELFDRRVVDRFPRFRQRLSAHLPVRPLAAPRWTDDPSFALEHHVVRHRIGDLDPAAELADEVSRQASVRFDPGHPRWCLHLFDLPDRSAILLRTHHSMADGVALVQLLHAFADPPADGGLHPGQIAVEPHRPAWFPPLPPPTAGLRTARVYRKLARLAEQDNPLRAPLTGAKQLAVSDGVDLGRVKEVAAASAGTVNDLGLAVLTGALRSYLIEQRGSEHVPARVGVTIPYNLRPPGRPMPASLGNQIGLVFLDLPVGLADPGERLAHICARTAIIKASPEAEVVRSGMAMVGALTHRPSAQAWMRLFTRRSTAVVTNIAGPSVPLQLDGVSLRRFMLWVPTSGSVGLGFSLVSYAGQLRFGVQVDDGVVPDVSALVRRLDHELLDIERYRLT